MIIILIYPNIPQTIARKIGQFRPYIHQATISKVGVVNKKLEKILSTYEKNFFLEYRAKLSNVTIFIKRKNIDLFLN